MSFELIEFLLSTNAKVERMMAVSAVMFEIVEMYIFQIHLHYFLFKEGISFRTGFLNIVPWYI
jgi:hypothetical protein